MLSDVVKDMEAKDPRVFEANRSNLRVFSMTEVSFSLGMMLGPLLTGSLFETIGFFYMTVALGMFISFLASSFLPHLLTLYSFHLLHPGDSFVALVRHQAPQSRSRILCLKVCYNPAISLKSFWFFRSD